MNHPVPLQKLQITDSFFSSRIRQMRDISIPYMWEALNDRIPDVPPSGCIANLRVAAGETQGAFIGCVFQDSDLWKWIEGVAYALAAKRDDGLEAQADAVIALAGKAQQPDGYLDTYYIINGLDKRFTNLRDNHELYVAGHMFEAAAAYYAATGKRALLDIACRFADCLEQAEDREAACRTLLQQVLEQHGRILFNGDGYSEEWQQEAARRGLLNLRTAPEAFARLTDRQNVELFARHGIFTAAELASR